MDVRPLAAAAAIAIVLAAVPRADARGYALTGRVAIRIADRDEKVVEQREERGPLQATAEADPPATWKVSYVDRGREVAQVLVDDPSGTVRESWTGYQVAWQMARGYEGQFGHTLNAPYVWLPIAALFLLGLFDWRRPLRIAHLDLLVLLSFGVSQALFNAGTVGLSVPLAYPPLLYLLARMLWIGFRGAGKGLRPTAPVAWLAVAAVFLIAFRLTLNVADSGVIDVGYAGVVGADRVAHGEVLYGEGAFPDEIPTGDTYGPASYYAYVPAELALPWSGEWDGLPAAHAASILFDLATIAGLFVLGRRLRDGADGGAASPGIALGTTLAFAWVAYPYTTFAMQSNSNDTLVAALLVWALVAFASPLGRGALLAAAAAAKFASLALAPLFVAGEHCLSARESRRPALVAAVVFVAVAAVMLAHPAVEPGLATFWDRTVGSQLGRDSPFSVWGQEPGLEPLQTAIKAAAAGLALLVALVPARRSLAQVGALAAAVTIAVQLTAEHWFYLYIVWFFPLALLALTGHRRTPRV